MLTGKKVLVIGLAKSGKAAVRLLTKLNATITINVNEEKDKIPEYDEYQNQGITLIVGGHPAELFEQEFDFVVKNPGINYHKPFILRLKERGIPVYTEIELGYQVAKPQNYVAVTGTNGKTTTVSLIADILKAQYQNVHLAGNVGTPLCDIIMDHNLLENADHYIVIEMSNFQLLDIETFAPLVSTIINLTPDHLDYMDSLEEYYASKTNIYKYQKEGYFILNVDDETVQQYIKEYPIPCQTITLSLQEKADCYLEDGYIKYKEEEILPISDIKVVGKHNIQNIMIAICMCKVCNVETAVLKKVIGAFVGVSHRIEFVREINDVKIYNDSKATNTDATITALEAFPQPIILLMGGHEKGLALDDVRARQDCIKYLVTFGAAGKRFLQDMQVKDASYIENLADATAFALQKAEPGDVIVLSPSTSSYDAFKSFEERGDYFKEIVNKFQS